MTSNDHRRILKAIGVGNGTDDDWSPESRIPLLDAVNAIIACLAVLGNGMVITVILLRRREFNSFTNRLILHQSIIDFFAGLVFFFQKVVRSPSIIVSNEGNSYDQFRCRLVASDFLLWGMSVTSTYNIVIISLERFMATCYPVKHRNAWSKGKFRFFVLFAWTVGLVDNAPLLFMIEAHQGHCRLIDMELWLYFFISSVAITIEYIVPMAILIYTHTRILIMLTKKLANPVSGPRRVIGKAKKNVLITTLLVGFMFVLCWTPNVFGYFNDFIFDESVWTGQLYSWFVALVACNMFVNPIIYCVKYDHFRSQLRDLVLKRVRRSRVHNLEPIPLNPR